MSATEPAEVVVVRISPIFSKDGQERVLRDIEVLLDHLNRAPEARLDAAFAAMTKPADGDPALRSTVSFLSRLAVVAARIVKSGMADAAATGGEATRHEANAMSDTAFLVWARDFLSSVAAPVTVESIRITRAYTGTTFRTTATQALGALFRWRRPSSHAGENRAEDRAKEQAAPADRAGGAGGHAHMPPPPRWAIQRHERIGHSLAQATVWWGLCTLVFVLVTLSLSLYVLTGTKLLAEHRALSGRFDALSNDMSRQEREDQALLKAHFAPPEAPRAGGDAAAPDAGQPWFTGYCSFFLTDPVTEQRRFFSLNQRTYCERFEGYMNEYLRLHRQMGTWLATAHALPPLPLILALDDAPAPALCDSGRCTATFALVPARPAVTAIAAAPVTTVPRPGPEQVAGSATPVPAASQASGGGPGTTAAQASGGGPGTAAAPLSQTELRSLFHEGRMRLLSVETVHQGLLDYVLPALYALLGALAAAFRTITARVRTVTLGFGDTGLIGQTALLGLLFGAVIGLFATQVGAASEAGGSLTPAALALVAGYSVSGVFRFLDGVTDRVFGAPAQAATGRDPK